MIIRYKMMLFTRIILLLIFMTAFAFGGEVGPVETLPKGQMHCLRHVRGKVSRLGGGDHLL